MSLVDRRGYLVVVLAMDKEDSLVVRRSEDLRDWYNIMQRRVKETKSTEMKSTKDFWKKNPLEKDQEWEKNLCNSLDRERGRRRNKSKDLSNIWAVQQLFQVPTLLCPDTSRGVRVKGVTDTTGWSGKGRKP